MDDTDLLQQRLELSRFEIEGWKARHSSAIAALPSGTTVVINLTTGEFLTASEWHEAWDQFEQRFGATTPGHSFTVGMPTVVGSGVWLK